MRKVIGVMPLYDDEKESYWMLPGYMNGIEAAGGAPIMLPLTDSEEVIKRAAELCDGLLLTGGQDVSPDVYDRERLSCCGELCPARDREEALLLDLFLKNDLPVLGICRGIQFLNAHLGGTLYQDLKTQYGDTVEHRMSPPYDRSIHTVSLVKGTPLHSLLGTDEISVNSYHHQGVRTLAPRLSAMAAATDGLVEAAYLPECTFALGVQWHPELNFEKDPASLRLFDAFAEACRRVHTARQCAG